MTEDKKFWQWMEEKDYARQDDEMIDNEWVMGWYIIDDDQNIVLYPTKQMLIGYIQEYLGEKDITFKHAVSHCYLKNKKFSIHKYYNMLEKLL